MNFKYPLLFILFFGGGIVTLYLSINAFVLDKRSSYAVCRFLVIEIIKENGTPPQTIEPKEMQQNCFFTNETILSETLQLGNKPETGMLILGMTMGSAFVVISIYLFLDSILNRT